MLEVARAPPREVSGLPDEGDAATDIGHLRGLRVDLDLAVAEVEAEVALLLRGDVLVADENDGALRDEERELVLLLVGEVLELDAYELGLGIGDWSEGSEWRCRRGRALRCLE